MQATMAAAHAALASDPSIAVQESDGYLLVTVPAPAGEADGEAAGDGQVLALFSRQAGWLTAAIQVVEEDSPSLSDDLLRYCFVLSEASGLVRVVRTNAGLWLRGDVPDPAQAAMLVEHLARATRGLTRGGDLAEALSLRPAAPPPTREAVAAVLGETSFVVHPFPELEGWRLHEPERPEGRPVLARCSPLHDALILLVGIHEAPEAELPPHFIETLLQVNDHMQASRFVLIAGLGLMVQAVVPLPASPAQLSAWIAQSFADAQQAVRSLAPAQDDLASRIRLLRAWLAARVEEGRLTEPLIAAAIKALVRQEPPPEGLPTDEPLLLKVLAEVEEVLFRELPARQPRALVVMSMGIENALKGRALDEVWEVALEYLDEAL